MNLKRKKRKKKVKKKIKLIKSFLMCVFSLLCTTFLICGIIYAGNNTSFRLNGSQEKTISFEDIFKK